MSRRIGNAFMIEPEEPDACELCGKTAELRPYGPGGKRICYQCGMKDRDATHRRMAEVMFGVKAS